MVSKMTLKKHHIIGFFFVLILGTVFHFVYDWSGQMTIVSYFASVNESPWEHLKLIFWPALFYGVYEYFSYGKLRNDFFAVKMTAIVSALLFTLIFFYTYSGILGFNLLALDIADFILADGICFALSYYMLSSSDAGSFSDSLKGMAVLLVIAMCFVLWTNNPPDLGVFWG